MRFRAKSSYLLTLRFAVFAFAVVLLKRVYAARDVRSAKHTLCIHGHKLLGACFCRPGFYGSSCDLRRQNQPSCTIDSDLCYHHPQFGVCAISNERWLSAQKAELALWKGSGSSTDDRADDHLQGFANYGAVPPYLGQVLEIGCGPWTQSTFMIERLRPHVVIDGITLWEPNALEYMKQVPTCAYKSGRLVGLKTTIVAKGAEELDRRHEFDTIVLINVLEHVRDVYKILQAVWDALKPGGTLIFNDKWWDHYNASTPVGKESNEALDHLYHPIRCHRKVYEHFLSQFVLLYRLDNPSSITKYGDLRGTYFIGMKHL